MYDKWRKPEGASYDEGPDLLQNSLSWLGKVSRLIYGGTFHTFITGVVLASSNGVGLALFERSQFNFDYPSHLSIFIYLLSPHHQ